MAFIERRKNQKPRVRWYTLGGLLRNRTCPDLATAKLLQADIVRTQALGSDWEETPERADHGPTLRAVSEAWLRHIAVRVTTGTLRVRAYQLDVFLRFMEQATDQPEPTTDLLSRARLHGYHEHLLQRTGRHGAARNPSTVRRMLGVVEAWWTWAHDWQTEDPTWTGWIPKAGDATSQLPRVATEHRPAPTWAQMAECVNHAHGWLRDLLVVLYYTGLRVQQALNLRRSDLDLAQGVLRIRPELGKTTQERAGRYVPVSSHFVAWVRSLPPVDGGWLLRCDRTQRKPRDRDAAAAWMRTRVPADRWEGRPHHAFRAGFISNTRRLGGDRDAVEYLVGHRAIAATDPHYMDPDALHLRAAVDLVPMLVLEDGESR